LGAAAKERARAFTWEAHAAKLTQVFESAREGHG